MLQKIIDFMGDDTVWATMIPGVIIQRRAPSRHVPCVPTAYFVDSHWKARKPDDPKVFDPWDHYQKPGTHKFCQTFAMMYLLGVLPPPVYDYTVYDMCARMFIRSVLDRLPDDHPAFAWDSRALIINCLEKRLVLKRGEFGSTMDQTLRRKILVMCDRSFERQKVFACRSPEIFT